MKKTVIFTLSLLWPTLGLAAPLLHETVEPYRVTGTSLFELGQQGIHSVRIPSPGRQRAVGLTQSEVTWRFKAQPMKDLCVLGDVEVEVNITTHLPEWDEDDRARASQETVEGWEIYIRALKLHEAGHKEITLESAREMERQMVAIPAMQDCDAISDEVARIGNAVMDDNEEQQEDYDRDTKHGETQGVRLH